ncbi:wings apart-like protein homolog [Styela clava]
MASSKPGIRTYVRKRKETAEEKYDAIFGAKPKIAPTAIVSPSKRVEETEIKRRRISKHDNELSPIKSISRVKHADKKSKESAEEKFDAIFGKSNGGSTTSPSKHTLSNTFSNSDEEDQSAEMTRSRDLFTSDDEEIDANKKEQTKYEKLFKRNEKLASDKFDAIFSESEYISKPKQHKSWVKNKTKDQSKVLDNLYSFNSWEDDSVSESSNSTSKNTSPQKSPTKLPSITHASMVKVGGRLVLNIQRGGNTNSLSDKRGIMLVSPGDKTAKPEFVTSTKPESSPIKKSDSIPLSSDRNTKSEYNFEEKSLEVHKQLQSRPVFKGLYKQETKDEIPKSVRISSLPTKKLLGSSRKKSSKPNVSYNPRPWAANSKDLQSFSQESSYSSDSLSSSQPSQSSQKSADNFSSKSSVPALKKSVTWPKNVGESIVTSLKCDKKHQEYFTVVRHVKNYQNCLEEGEIQEYEDEVLYLQEGLPSHQPISVRCLSVTSLACKCEQQNFRLYLRAHNVLTKVFDDLQDADENRALSLATSSLLYMLSRDRQIDINKATLRILLKLVDPLEKNKDGGSSNKPKVATPPKSKFSKLYKRKQEAQTTNSDQELEAVKSKIKDLIDRCGDPLVTSQDLSTKVLASEALLRYTARKTSEWFREEIRLKGGLDHVISSVKAQVDIIENLPANLDCSCQPLRIERPLCTLERLLRVLENGIINSARNAMYLVTHQRALLLKKISLLMTRCKKWLAQTEDVREPDTPPSSSKAKASLLIKNVIAQIIKLLVNISNDNEWSSTRIGDQEGMLDNILSCILHIPEHVDEEHRYEIMLLSLGLMVNLVESSAKNRMSLMQMKTRSADQDDDEISIVDALVHLFIAREVAARDNEILGEDGVKRAAEAKRMQKAGSAGGLNKSSQHAVGLGDADDEGYWVESEEGMEWVSVQSKRDDDDLPSSQGSHRSITNPNNIEAKLTAEEKDEMRQALEKANDHMEASIIASYTALVLGCLIHGSRMNATAIRSRLPDNGDLSSMIKMLKKFLSFMYLTHGMSKKGEQKLIQVIEDMEEVNLDKSI